MSADPKQSAETALSNWKKIDDAHQEQRDPLIVAALEAGVNIHRIFIVTGLSRGVVYRLLDKPQYRHLRARAAGTENADQDGLF